MEEGEGEGEGKASLYLTDWVIARISSSQSSACSARDLARSLIYGLLICVLASSLSHTRTRAGLMDSSLGFADPNSNVRGFFHADFIG